MAQAEEDIWFPRAAPPFYAGRGLSIVPAQMVTIPQCEPQYNRHETPLSSQERGRAEVYQNENNEWHHFPMQKSLKMRSTMSSVTVSPVINPIASNAPRRSTEISSAGRAVCALCNAC